MSSNTSQSTPHKSLEDNELTSSSSRLYAEPTIPQHIMPSQDLLDASYQYNYQAAILNGIAMNDICAFHLPPVVQSNYTSYNPVSSIRGNNNNANNDDDERKLPASNIDMASIDIKSAMAKAQKESKIDIIFKGKVAFPLMLTYMLESVEDIGKSHIIHWTPDDKFVIKDVDAFLTEILPKFFKSENAKIKSFYRKLNRWGFSMARKRANSPGDLWSHQVFTREIAVRALYESLETGVAIDFLSGSRRRSEKSLSDSQTSDSLSTIATASITSPSVTTLHSMPARLPSSTREKRLSQSMTSALAHRESRKRLSHSWTSSNMQHDIQSMQQQHHAAQTGQPIGAVNATFDLISARTYDMLSSSSAGGLNPSSNMFVTREQIAQMYPHPALTGALSQPAMLPPEPMFQGPLLQPPEDAFSMPPPRSIFGNMGMQPNGTATRRHSEPISQVGNLGLSTNEDQELSEFFDMFAQDLPPGEDLTRGLDIPTSLSQQASHSHGQHNALRRIEESTLGTVDSSSQEQQVSDYDTAVQNALALLQQLQNDKT